MYRITLLLFVSVSLLSGQVAAQDLLPTIAGQRVDLYEYARNMMQTSGLDQPPKMINELPHAIFRYEGNTINASQLNENLAGATAFKSESYTLTLPNLTGMVDTLVMMVGVPGVDDERIVSTVIIGNMRDKLAYYVDYNHNFDFTDDGSFLFFTKKEKASLVKINKAGVNTPYEYILYDLALVPEYLATLDVKLINAPMVKEKKEPKFAVPFLSRSSRLNLQFGFLTGSGNMRFAYNNMEDVNKEYSAAIDAISRFTMSASYAFQHLNVGATVAIEANQIGREEQYVTDQNDPSDVLINYNIGNWPRTRFIYGVFAEYDLRLIRNSYLTPYFFIFRYNHLSEEGFAGYGSEVDEASPFNSVFTNRVGQQFGAKLKLPMSEKVLAVLDVGYTRNGFDLAEGFIQETHAATSINTEYGTINYGVGVQFLLFNGKEKVSKNLPAEKKL